MKQTAEEFKHTKVVSPSGNELFFDEQGKFIKEEPKQQTAVEWFAEKMENLYFVNFKKFFSLEIEQAKELEKQKQGYSEEDMRKAIQETITLMRYKATEFREHENTVIEQFKNK